MEEGRRGRKDFGTFALQFCGGMLAHAVMQQLNEKGAFAVAVLGFAVAFLWYSPFVAAAIRELRNDDVQRDPSGLAVAAFMVKFLAGIAGFAITVGMAFIGFCWLITSFGIGSIDLLTPDAAAPAPAADGLSIGGEVTPGMIYYVAASVFTLFAGTFGYVLLGGGYTHPTLAADMKAQLNVLRKLLLNSTSAMLVHKVKDTGLFTDAFVIGGCLVVFTTSFLYGSIPLARDIKTLVAVKSSKKTVDIGAGLVWIFVGIGVALVKPISTGFQYGILILFLADYLIANLPSKLALFGISNSLMTAFIGWLNSLED